MSTVDPAELLRLAKTGDAAALGELLSRYRQYLSLLAGLQVNRRLRGKADASDLVQEAFLEAHRHFEQFRGRTERELAAWLRSILAALISNHVRRYLGTGQRDANLERGLAAELDHTSRVLDRGLLAGGSSPSQQVARRESGVLLADALAQLPPDYRQTVVLRNFEGLSFAEIAAQMDRSVDSVQKLWVRALARLREALVTLST
ncbi:MAG TPA: sigma-70 family RNA polymerase sigma factor [Pirellulales bacterium]|jgi:RNA polymerase sigma-70 factor (ECF subfamily)|nr:sigma-70 family RNA polymerase sigma factor [Pirellulales bacterium]HEX4142405.1 sigma-70 family RNA polymerase sigma factor [Pirellulales bacterium]